MAQFQRWSLHFTRLLAVCAILIGATACPTGGGLKSIILSSQSVTLALGENTELKAFGAASDHKVTEVTDEVQWSVGDAAIASVTEGNVRALGAGRTVVTATDPASGTQASAEVVVTEAQLLSLSLSPQAPSLPLGVSQPLLAKAAYSDGRIVDVTSQALWSTSNAAIASVGTSGMTAGVLTTRKAGQLTIQAEFGGKQTSMEARVTSAELSQLVVTAARTLIPAGTQIRLKAMGVYTDGSMLDVTTSVLWSTADPAVASISNMDFSRGMLTSRGTGLTEVVATDPVTLKEGRLSFGVSNAELARIEIAHPGLTVPVLNNGESLSLRATGIYSDGTNADLTALVVWNSATPTVATVSPLGVIQARAVGETEIRATLGSTIGSVRFRVAEPVLTRLQITAPTTAQRLGDTYALLATAVYSDGSTQDVTKRVVWSWGSTNTALFISQEDGSEGVLWMGRATTPTVISATLGSLSATATILSANSASLPFYSFGFRLVTIPIVKRTVSWMSSTVNFGGPLNARELIAITPVTVTARSPGVVVTLLDGPGLKGQIWMDGPTGGTFTLSYVFPFGIGSGSFAYTLP